MVAEKANDLVDLDCAESDEFILRMISKSIQYEFYTLTGQVSDDENTNIHYYQYLMLVILRRWSYIVLV